MDAEGFRRVRGLIDRLDEVVPEIRIEVGCLYPVDSSGRVPVGTGPCGREKPPGQPGAAVHRHTLDRVNAINDSLK